MTAAAEHPGLGPVIDGRVLPVDPATALASGRFAKVPAQHGITRDEYRLHVFGHGVRAVRR
jgi:para-nitrobenzyl esterase